MDTARRQLYDGLVEDLELILAASLIYRPGWPGSPLPPWSEQNLT
jgi:hypothetical protein